MDDRRQWQVTSLRSKRELEGAMDCLRRRGTGAGAHLAGGIFRRPRATQPAHLDTGRLPQSGGGGAAGLAAGRNPAP